jgi:hypothetical protein
LIERTSAAARDPQIAASVRDLLNAMMNIDAAQAAERHLDEVPALALTQNTGLKLGEVRNTSTAEATGIGPPMIKKMTLRIARADAASGDVQMVLTENFDPDSIRQFLVAVAGRTGRDPEDMKKMDITLDGRTEFEVVDGMTRTMRRRSTMSSNLMGNTLVITDRKDVTVTAAP